MWSFGDAGVFLVLTVPLGHTWADIPNSSGISLKKTVQHRKC